MRILFAVFPHFRSLVRFFLLNYVIMLINTAGYLRDVHSPGVFAWLFVAAVYLTYCAAYMLPALVVALGADAVISRKILTPLFRRASWAQGALVGGVAVLAFGAVQVLMFADRFIHGLYDFHINGFVWNLVTTKGGIRSMGGDSASTWTFAGIVLGFFLLEALVLAAFMWVPRVRRAVGRVTQRRMVATFAAAVLLLSVFHLVAYGVCSLTDYVPVLATADVMPFYRPVTFRHFAENMGFERAERETYNVPTDAVSLKYPIEPIVRAPAHRKYNIVWLVAESWRADMLDPEITPATWAFAGKGTRFTDHYSSGNGTRMGLFGMFYGLYGNYWFSFLRERRGPVLVDVLRDDDYQMSLYTSAAFTYPEFDRTLFARVPPDELHQSTDGRPGWQWDRVNVEAMLKWLDARDREKPFFTFMFFESPHARYYFPDEAAIRKPYLEEMNYATMDVKRDIGLIKNRYINACHNLDSQFARVLGYLEEHKLLDSTIVIVTGDHGEEFMEKGHWGHGSTFCEEQTRVPLVVYVPGRDPAVIGRMTSHLDLPATVLPLLGVTNPPSDYSQGADLFAGRRDYCVLASWTKIAFADAEHKAVFSTELYTGGETVTDAKDQPFSREVFNEQHRKQIVEVMTGMKRFAR